MTSARKTSTIVGLLFLIQTAAFIVAEQLINGHASSRPSLADVPAHASSLVAGGLLAAVSGMAVVGISVLLFPVLKGTSEPLALAYVCERVVELVLQVVFFLIVPMMLVQLDETLHGRAFEAYLSPSLSTSVAGVALVVLYLVTSVGGTVLGVLLYRSRLVPRWLAALALLGYPMLLVGCVLDLFGATDVTAGLGLVAIAPGGFFELILPIWLLARGFASVRPSATSASPQFAVVG